MTVNGTEEGFCNLSEFQDLFGVGQQQVSNHGVVLTRNMYVNYPANQNASVFDQQYLQGLQNQQVLFGETLDYNQFNTISSGGSNVYKFQQDNDYVGSPTLTTNSERSEITEASTGDFRFQRRLLEIQPQIFPQLQQQNFLNPYSSLLDEKPLNDSSQGYTNLAQRNVSPSQQGTLNRTMFSIGLGSEQLDVSRTLVANARGDMGQQPPIQVMYQEPGSLAARPPSDQSHKSLMQFSDFNNPFLKNQYDLSPSHASLQQKSGMPEASSVHGLNNGLFSSNILMKDSQKFDISSKDSSGMQEEQVSWSSFHQKSTDLSQGLVPLDPLEEKILFNMEDGSTSEIASGVFGAKFDNVNFSNPFPSMQSGSWSALMQNALAEASSSDTGLQEEFSSLTYQNMELSTDINDISNFMDSDKQHAGCVNNNTLQASVSLNSSFPGFQLPSDQLRSCMFQDENAPDSTQRFLNVTGHWADCNPQQLQSGVSFDNLSTDNMYLQSSGMLDRLQSQTCNHPSSTADSSTSQLVMSSLDHSQAGNWVNAPGHLRKVGTFPHSIQHNDPATVYVSQMPTINPFAGVNPDAGLGGHTSSQTRSPQQGTSRQFNVWMDLPTTRPPLDQESLNVPLNSTSPGKIWKSDDTTWQKAQHMSFASYNMPHRVGLPREEGAAAKNISVFTASNNDVNKLQGVTNMDFSTCSKLYEQNDGLKMPISSRLSSMSQRKSIAFNVPKMEQNVCSSGKQPSGMEHSHLSPPTSAPVWFKHMEAFDQMQPAFDFEETPNQLTQHSKPLNEEITAQKKRKLMRTKQLAWHEEVSNASQRDHTISGSEQEWARVSKLLIEKAEYDTQTFEFALPLHRSKRRLVLTSQLMQQLVDPPPSFILFSPASSIYSSLLFFVARATLGDAYSSLTHKRENVHRSEVAKVLTEKAKKLGESFERLEKTQSMADIKCEIADLERFSVINRFARFHSKGPIHNNSGNPSQSSLLKPIPQRYIAVRSIPQNLPDRIHCLSL